MMKNILWLLGVLFLAACTAQLDADEAEHAVPEFHLALMGGDFAGIYQRAAPGLQAQESQSAFVARLQRQHAVLGEVRGADRTATEVKGREARLTYRTAYAAGVVSEEFVIQQLDGAAPRLLAYRLLSPLPLAISAPAPSTGN